MSIVPTMNDLLTPYKNLIDSHFHLIEMGNRGFSIPAVLEEMVKLSFTGGVDIAMSPEDHLVRRELTKKYPIMRIASGIGPWWLNKGKTIDEMIDMLLSLFVVDKPDAIGEVGLEFFHECGTVEDQKELLSRQIEISQSLQVPVIIHNREADDEMINTLRNYSFPYGGIIHCFSSDIKFAEFALTKGFSLSFAGPITYKKNDDLRNVLKEVPLTSLLLETDSPFLAPQNKRGKPNTPLYISSIYEKAAEVKGIEINQLIESINENFLRMFPIKERTY